MEFVADLHLHSRYSRAVSQSMSLPIMAAWAKKKGIHLLTTSDWTHPLWLREIKASLEEAEEGIYWLKNSLPSDPKFILSVEISSIYTQDGRVRRIHNVLFAPNISTAEKINAELVKRGCNISSDGRPIVGLTSKQLLELALTIDRKVILIPAHVWTPHFGLYGSASGFDSIEECFGDLSRYIYGIETGISSDPFMNWQIPELQKRAIVSFSDAHSPAKMGREVTVFKLPKLSYMNIGKALARPDENCKIAYTLEFYPEEGKYHFSGHRNCDISMGPQEIKEKGNICPVCNRRMTEGVMFRVQQVAKKEISTSEPQLQFDEFGVGWIEDPAKVHPRFVKLVPLNEIVAESMDSTVSSERVKSQFDMLCSKFGSEITVLLKTPLEEIEKAAGAKLGEGVLKVRRGNISIKPGFDGEYGKVKIWSTESEPEEIQFAKKEEEQMGIF